MSLNESIPSLADYQRQAHEFLKEEQWSNALQLLNNAIRHYPESADLFSDLAAAERAAGNLEAAIKHYQSALRLDPKLAFVHRNLGNALADHGEHREAIDCYHRALVLQPRYPAALNDLAMALLRESRVEEARKALERLFGITRDHLPAFETLANLCERQGNQQEALKHYGSLAQHYLKVNKPAEALRSMDACQRLGLRSAALQTNRSAALLQLQRPAEAKTAAQMALQLDPNHANAHVNLASAYVALHDNRSAIPCLKRATDLAPNLAPAFINLGNAYAELGEFSEAGIAHQRALGIAPDSPQALVGLAHSLEMEGRTDEALSLYRKALSIAPNFPEAHTKYGLQLLARGEFREGFKEYEWRRAEPAFQSRIAQAGAATYNGEPLAGRTVLLLTEGDISDVIQFLRYARRLAQQGARVFVDCPPPLHRLLNAQPYIERAFDGTQEQHPCEFVVPLVSLAYVTESHVLTAEGEVPYIQPPAASPRIAELSPPGLKVGLVWAANPHYRPDQHRSVNLGLIDAIAEGGGVHWYSLQVGAGREQIAAAPRMRPTDLAHYLGDYADAVAAISQLDLIISVDAPTAHLAGALGKPVWTLLSQRADWRWPVGRDDSPWYPNMRLFRQQRMGDWTGIVSSLKQAITAWRTASSASGSQGSGTPGQVPPAQAPPAQGLLAQAPPAQAAPGLTPSAQAAPGLTPSAQAAPGLTPSAQAAPGLTPSAQAPPAQAAPGLTPSAQAPPAQAPPAQAPPAQAPPAQAPVAQAPPVVESHPAGTPAPAAPSLRAPAPTTAEPGARPSEAPASSHSTPDSSVPVPPRTN